MIQEIHKIDQDDIVNKKDLPLLQSMVCSIDLYIPVNPVFCANCQNIFCSDCINNWKNQSQVCPICKTVFNQLPNGENSLITQEINNIRLKCKYSKNGCSKELQIQNKAFHESNCDYMFLECNKCHQQIPKIFLEKHLFEDCTKNQIQCYLCEKSFSICNIVKHLSSCDGKQNKEVINIINCDKCNQKYIHSESNNEHKCENELGSNLNLLIDKCKQDYMENEKKEKEKMKKIYQNAMTILKDNKIAFTKLRDKLNREIDLKKNSLLKIKQIKTSHYSECITFLKNSNKKIEKSIQNKENELQRIETLLKITQPLLQKEISENYLLAETEMKLKKQMLDKISLENKDINNSDITKNKAKELLLTKINIIPNKESIYFKGKCNICQNESSEMVKCNICHSNICKKCQIKCPNEKTKNFFYCQKCFTKCSFCDVNFCKKCLIPCFNSKCSNVFCPDCYRINEHQVKGKDDNCKIFACEICEMDHICIMQSYNYHNTRICLKCYGIILENEITNAQK